jgi:hypothetical protein
MRKNVNYKLGKLPVRHDRRTFMFHKYLTALPPVKPAVDWTPFVNNWGMMKNDTLGDCTCAAAGHLIELWTAAASDLVVPTDSAIVAAYSGITGYNPSDPNTDQGAVELDVLNYWRTIGIAGHKIGAYAKIDVPNHNYIKIACDMFAGVYIGFNVTQAMMDNIGKPWVLPLVDGPSIGGHAVPIVGYDVNGITLITWGATQVMGWDVWDKFVDEAYAIYSQDFINGVNSPSAFDATTLQADLQAL